MKNKFRKAAFFCILFISPYVAFADDIDDGNGNGDVQDVPVAPIDDYIPIAFVVALGLSYTMYQKKIID